MVTDDNKNVHGADGRYGEKQREPAGITLERTTACGTCNDTGTFTGHHQICEDTGECAGERCPIEHQCPDCRTDIPDDIMSADDDGPFSESRCSACDGIGWVLDHSDTCYRDLHLHQRQRRRAGGRSARSLRPAHL